MEDCDHRFGTDDFARSNRSDGARGNALRRPSREDNHSVSWGAYSKPASRARHTVDGHHSTAPLLVCFALSLRTELERSKMAMEHTRCGCCHRVVGQFHTAASNLCGAPQLFPKNLWGLEPVATLLLWLYFTGAAILIGGEANSEIEKAASEAGHTDARRPQEQRSGGAASDANAS